MQERPHIQMSMNTRQQIVLLATACIRLESPDPNFVVVRAMLDQGSESFITKQVAQVLKSKRRLISVPIIGLHGSSTGVARVEIKLVIRSLTHLGFKLPVSALVMPNLCPMLFAAWVHYSNWLHLSCIPLTDPEFAIPGHVDAILRSDVYGLCMEGEVCKAKVNTPTAISTVFRWELINYRLNCNGFGKLRSSTKISHYRSMTILVNVSSKLRILELTKFGK